MSGSRTQTTFVVVYQRGFSCDKFHGSIIGNNCLAWENVKNYARELKINFSTLRGLNCWWGDETKPSLANLLTSHYSGIRTAASRRLNKEKLLTQGLLSCLFQSRVNVWRFFFVGGFYAERQFRRNVLNRFRVCWVIYCWIS